MKKSYVLFRFPFLTILFLLVSSQLAQPVRCQVRMWEEPLTVPTYETGPADRNPIFYSGRGYQGAKGPVYPYPLLDRLTDRKVDKTYRAVYLENPYIKICILPEIGGRIFEGIDKTNGYNFFYRQHVIKPALIGMTGAWISGGVEWNIPHHHRASTFMPVDRLLVDNPDGSKTVWVGETERRHRMRWMVGLTLHPGKSVIEATVKLINRTALPHSMLYFANVAVNADSDYQVIFPPSTQFGTQHSKIEFVRWPVGDGRYGGDDRTGVDVSWWRSLPDPVSIFAWNYRDDFFGGYDHGKEAGVTIVADHHTVPGKKFFEFANGPEGFMWDRILTDSDGPYLELMSGAYSDNQPDYSWVQPGEVKTAKQIFFPIRALGGIKNANGDAAVNLEVNSNRVCRIAFNATSAFKGAKAVLTAGGRTLFEKTIDISPDAPFACETRLPGDVGETDLKASLSSADGTEIISYVPAPAGHDPMPKPVVPPPDPKDVATNEELYLAGLRLEQFYNPNREPYPYYEEAVRRDPGDSRCNTALGILYCKRGMFDVAERHLAAAIERITRNYTMPKDGEAFYYMGVAQRALGKTDSAVVWFNKAAWSLAWTGAARTALAEIACAGGGFAAALGHCDLAIAANASNSRALDLKAALLRKTGRTGDAGALIEKTLGDDPLDFWALNERALLQGDAARRDCADRMRGEAQAYLELASDYARCGLWAEAAEVLERFIESAPDKNKIDPMVHYDLAAYESRGGHPGSAESHLRLASLMPADYCFPYRIEDIGVLKSAMEKNPLDGRAPYYLGNLLYDIQPENAIEAWEKARSLDPKSSLTHRNLGFAYARIENDNAKAIASYENAVECNPKEARYFAELDALYEAAGVSQQKRLALLEKNHATLLQRDDALIREITLDILAGKVDRAIQSLESRHFRRWEGEERGPHDLYVDAHLLRGQRFLKAGKPAKALEDFLKADEYPDRFEEGRPGEGGGRNPRVDYSIASAYEAMGNREKAEEYFRLAVRLEHREGESGYYQGLASRKLGEEAKALESFDGLIEAGKRLLAPRTAESFYEKFGSGRSESVRQARGHYLTGLGLLGKGLKADAKKEFESAVRLDYSLLGARTMAAELP
jgi:tetratricopeptide (TPR) repeat protein